MSSRYGGVEAECWLPYFLNNAGVQLFIFRVYFHSLVTHRDDDVIVFAIGRDRVSCVGWRHRKGAHSQSSNQIVRRNAIDYWHTDPVEATPKINALIPA